MRSIFVWAATAVLAAGLGMSGQTPGQNAPRGVDKDGDGKCDVCGRPVSQIGQGRGFQGPGMMRGRGFRGRGMRCMQNCPRPCCQGQTQAQPQPPAPEPKK